MELKFNKPSNWKDLLLHEKIKEYGKNLDHRYAAYVDKLSAKKIVRSKLGPQIEICKVYEIFTAEEFNCGYIRNNCLLKAAHGSRWNLDLDLINECKIVKDYIQQWNRKYTDQNPEEVQYGYLSPRFFIEEKINDYRKGQTSFATTFLFHCIYGKPVVLQVLFDFDGRRYLTNRYLISGREDLSLDRVVGTYEDALPDMSSLKRMYKYSEELSKDFEFVRIDFYLDASNNIHFSEFTFTPNAGAKAYPDYLEKQLGDLWN